MKKSHILLIGLLLASFGCNTAKITKLNGGGESIEGYNINVPGLPNDQKIALLIIYGSSRIAWEKEEGGSRKSDMYEREIFSSEMIAEFWKKMQENGDASPSQNVEDLVKIEDAGFMREYVWVYLYKEGWVEPEDLNLDTFKAWADQNLLNHKPMFTY